MGMTATFGGACASVYVLMAVGVGGGEVDHSLACSHQLLEQHAHPPVLNVQHLGQLTKQERGIKLAWGWGWGWGEHEVL